MHRRRFLQLSLAAGLAASLLAVAGVTDVVIVADESAAYLKVDSKLLDREALDRVAAPV